MQPNFSDSDNGQEDDSKQNCIENWTGEVPEAEDDDQIFIKSMDGLNDSMSSH